MHVICMFKVQSFAFFMAFYKKSGKQHTRIIKNTITYMYIFCIYLYK